jgi:elongation factor 1-gamma
MSFINSEVQPSLANWFKPLVGRRAYDQKNVENARAITNTAIAILETHFLKTGNKYFLGQDITLADLFTASSLSRGYQYVFDKKWQSRYPQVTKWFTTVINLPIWKAVVPRFTMIEEAVSGEGLNIRAEPLR